MLPHIARLSKDSIIYGIGGSVARFTGLILLPLYTHIFSTDNYGILQSVNNLGALLLAITVLGLDGAASLLYFATDDPRKRRLICSLWIWLSVAVSTPLTLLLIILANWVSLVASGTTEHANLFRLGIAVLPFSLLQVTFNGILRFTFRPRSYAVLNFSLTVLVALFSIYFVVFLRLGLQGALWGTLLGTALVALGGAWAVRDTVRITEVNTNAWPPMKRLLKLGLPLVPASVALWIISFSNTYFLIQMKEPGEAGIFRAGAQLAAILGLGIWAFQLAWGPYSLSIAREPDAPNTYSRIATLFMAGAVGASVLMSAVAPVLLKIFTTKDYASAAPVIGLLALAASALGAYYVVAIGVSLKQRTGQIAWTTIVAAALNITLNALLIPNWGIVGAGLASLAANLTSTTLVYWMSQRYYPLPYQTFKLLIIWMSGLFCVMLAGVFNVAMQPSIWLSIAVALVLTAGYTLVLLAIGAVKMSEIKVARNAIWGMVARRIGANPGV